MFLKQAVTELIIIEYITQSVSLHKIISEILYSLKTICYHIDVSTLQLVIPLFSAYSHAIVSTISHSMT